MIHPQSDMVRMIDALALARLQRIPARDHGPLRLRSGYSTGFLSVVGQMYDVNGLPSIVTSTRRPASFGTTWTRCACAAASDREQRRGGVRSSPAVLSLFTLHGVQPLDGHFSGKVCIISGVFMSLRPQDGHSRSRSCCRGCVTLRAQDRQRHGQYPDGRREEGRMDPVVRRPRLDGWRGYKQADAADSRWKVVDGTLTIPSRQRPRYARRARHHHQGDVRAVRARVGLEDRAGRQQRA